MNVVLHKEAWTLANNSQRVQLQMTVRWMLDSSEKQVGSTAAGRAKSEEKQAIKPYSAPHSINQRMILPAVVTTLTRDTHPVAVV